MGEPSVNSDGSVIRYHLDISDIQLVFVDIIIKSSDFHVTTLILVDFNIIYSKGFISCSLHNFPMPDDK